MRKTDIVREFIKNNPTLPNRRIAIILHTKYPDIFDNIENTRSIVRTVRGARGKRDRSIIDEQLWYQLPDPVTIDNSFYDIPGKSLLVLSDIHFPYNDNTAIKSALTYTMENYSIDSILLNGDIIDFTILSAFSKNYYITRSVEEEIEDLKDFIELLRFLFPKASIYYKLANHERRYYAYIASKTPDLSTIDRISIFEKTFGIDSYGVITLPSSRFIRFGQLTIIHGDEISGYSNIVSPARLALLRCKSPTLVSHWHTTSEYSERTIKRELITCWSIGCLCNLYVEYKKHNNWNHGFAVVTRDKLYFHVHNYRIENGVIY